MPETDGRGGGGGPSASGGMDDGVLGGGGLNNVITDAGASGAGGTDGSTGPFCFGPLFPDFDADYDGDGIPCGEDPCLFDGPSPPAYPTSVGYAEVNVSAVDVAGTGRSHAIVPPGAQFTVDFDYLVKSCACEGCVTQGLAGLQDNVGGPPVCFYSGVPGCSMSGLGRTSIALTAPMAPGMYALRVQHSWEFDCVLTYVLANPNYDFGAICVAP